MDVIYACCCGLDVHKKSLVACLPGNRGELLDEGVQLRISPGSHRCGLRCHLSEQHQIRLDVGFEPRDLIGGAVLRIFVGL